MATFQVNYLMVSQRPPVILLTCCDGIFNQSNQHRMCGAPIYETPRAPTSHLWYARSNMTNNTVLSCLWNCFFCAKCFLASKQQCKSTQGTSCRHLRWDHITTLAVMPHIEPWVFTQYTRTTPVFDLHFGSSYTSAEFHICIFNGCDAVVLTRFCWLSGTDIQRTTCHNTRNQLFFYTTRYISKTTFWFVDTDKQTLRETDTFFENENIATAIKKKLAGDRAFSHGTDYWRRTDRRRQPLRRPTIIWAFAHKPSDLKGSVGVLIWQKF